MVYHVLNRGVGRRTLFEKDGDFLAFEKVVEETLSRQHGGRLKISIIVFSVRTYLGVAGQARLQ